MFTFFQVIKSFSNHMLVLKRKEKKTHPGCAMCFTELLWKAPASARSEKVARVNEELAVVSTILPSSHPSTPVFLSPSFLAIVRSAATTATRTSTPAAAARLCPLANLSTCQRRMRFEDHLMIAVVLFRLSVCPSICLFLHSSLRLTVWSFEKHTQS